MLAWVPGMAELILIGAFVAVLVLIVLAISRAGQNARRFPAEGFSVKDADGPGRYRVDGVISTTKAETSVVIDAQSAGNAKVKAELDGIIATRVTREP